MNYSLATTLTNRLTIETPIIQAPMAGGATMPELVAAVANAGGLGSLAAGYLQPHEISHAIQQVRALTDKPFAVNLFIPQKHFADAQQIERARNAIQHVCQELAFTIPPIQPPYAPSFDAQMQVVIDECIPIFSFTFGVLEEKWLTILKQSKVFIMGTATTLAEALALEENGVDAIVAQGAEAGGHRGTFIGYENNLDNLPLIDLTTLLKTLLAHIKIPVIAAGGIMQSRKILECLLLGAKAVQMGTAFLCCHESGVAHAYKTRIIASKNLPNQTVLTRAFSGKFARGINNQFILRMQAFEDMILDYPIQNALTSAMRKEAARQDNHDFMSLWAGSAYPLCQEMSAAELITQLKHEVAEIVL